MAETKTKVNDASVAKFFDAIKDPQVRDDCRTIANLMEVATKAKPKMWGSAIVGFGTTTIVYAGGREGEWPMIGFSPRKKEFALYGLSASKEDAALLAKLGKHSWGKGCLYIRRLEDIHVPALKQIVTAAVKKKAKR